jgi:glycine cleavage system H protein
MELDDSNSLLYKRSLFVTRLPLDRLYTASHCWLYGHAAGWRVGLTKFGARLLGELVDYSFEGLQSGDLISAGQVIGWIEGLKAVSDLSSAISGKLVGINPLLAQDPEVVYRDCYGDGWLYEAQGQPDPQCLDLQGYKALLDKTIDEFLEKRKSSE